MTGRIGIQPLAEQDLAVFDGERHRMLLVEPPVIRRWIRVRADDHTARGGDLDCFDLDRDYVVRGCTLDEDGSGDDIKVLLDPLDVLRGIAVRLTKATAEAVLGFNLEGLAVRHRAMSLVKTAVDVFQISGGKPLHVSLTEEGHRAHAQEPAMRRSRGCSPRTRRTPCTSGSSERSPRDRVRCRDPVR